MKERKRRHGQVAWRMSVVQKVPLLAALSGYDQKKIVDWFVGYPEPL